MKPLFSAALLLSGIFAFTPAFSQTSTDTDGLEQGNVGFWEVVTSNGRFIARLDKIASASQHEYFIDGAVKVYEVTVETDGGQTGRFYYLESVAESSSITTGSATINRLRDVANKVSDKAGTGDIDTMVTKHYPDTTHAKTSEYRLKSKETIDRIYEHIRRVWAEEKGRGDGNRLVIRNG